MFLSEKFGRDTRQILLFHFWSAFSRGARDSTSNGQALFHARRLVSVTGVYYNVCIDFFVLKRT